MKMTFKLFALCALTLAASTIQARLSSEDKAFIKAAKHRKIEVVKRLFPCVSKRAYDKALLEVARKGDIELFNMISPCASPKGYCKAVKSLVKHGHAYYDWFLHAHPQPRQIAK